MPTVDNYKAMLNRATEAGDTAAQRYFQSQIDKALEGQTPESRSKLGILDPLAQGLTFGFGDELGGAFAGAAEKLTGGDFWPTYKGTKAAIEGASDDYIRDNPVKGTLAEIAGGLAFPLGALRTGANTFATAAKAGAAYGAGKSNTDEDASLPERAAEVAADTGFGAAAGTAGNAALRGLSGLGRAIFPRASVRGRSPEYRGNLDRVHRAGIETTPGSRLDNPTIRQSEEILSRYFANPDATSNPGRQLSSALMGRANFRPQDIASGQITREATERAGQNFTRGYDRLLRDVRVPMRSLDPYLRRIEAGWNQALPHEQKAVISQIIRDFRAQASGGGVMSGRDLKRVLSNLKKKRFAASRSEGDRYLVQVYDALSDIVDNALRQTMPQRAYGNLKELDRRYGAYRLLKDVADKRARPEEFFGTLANEARKNRSRVDHEFVDLLNAFDDVFLRGGWKSSGTPEGTASVTNVIPPIPSMVRGVSSQASDMANRTLPSGLPIPAHTGAFVAGQQTPPELAEEMLKAVK